MLLPFQKATGYSRNNLKTLNKNKTKLFNQIMYKNQNKMVFARLNKNDNFVFKEYDSNNGTFTTTTAEENKFSSNDKTAIFQKGNIIHHKFTTLINTKDTKYLISFDIQNCLDIDMSFEYSFRIIKINSKTNRIQSISGDLYQSLCESIKNQGLNCNKLMIQSINNINEECHIFLAYNSQIHQFVYNVETNKFNFRTTKSLSKPQHILFDFHHFSNGINSIINVERVEKCPFRPRSFTNPFPHQLSQKPEAILNKWNNSTNEWMSCPLETKFNSLKFDCIIILKGKNCDILAIENLFIDDDNKENVEAKFYLINQRNYCIKSINIKLESCSKYKYCSRRYHMIFKHNTEPECHENIVEGYVRWCFNTAFKDVVDFRYPPSYLIKLFSLFYSNETIQVLCYDNANDRLLANVFYWELNVDDVYNHIE